jgi:putative ABC transport system ATP-binding protein
MIEIADLHKTFKTPAGDFPALRGIGLSVAAGELLAIAGKSGSGKSTLLHLAGGLDTPTSGTIRVAGRPVAGKSEKELAAWRGRSVGFVFQFFQLMPTLTALENVMLPMDFLGALPADRRRQRAQQLLDGMGIAEQAHKLPAALSGGQQQRVAIARALANDPPLLLADEPTGNLDSATAAAVLSLFRGLADSGKTVLIATHERDIAGIATRVLTLADGRLLAEGNIV